MFPPTGAPSVTFRLRSLALVVSLLAATGCNVIPNGMSNAKDMAVAIVPGSVTVRAGQTAQFAARVTGGNDGDVIWSLASPTPQLGQISRAGVYKAPAGLMRSIHVSVVATSAVDPTRIATATVTVTPSPAISVIVLPQAVTLQAGSSQQFMARVGGTSNNDVTWSVSSNSSPAGSVTSTGLYTAPSDVYAAMQVIVTATSVADPAESASTFITINPLANVRVTITPPGATLLAGGTQQLAATVTGSTNNNVTWSLTSTVAQAGYISQSGLYTAPATLNSTILAVVTATSVADPTRSASALLTVNPADSVHVSVTPASASLPAGGVQLLYPNVTGTNNRGVTWSLTSSASQPGSISSLGLYTAPTSVTSSIQITATATSVADPTQSASALLTVNPVASVHISVTPPSETLPSGGTQQFSASVTGTSNTAATWSMSPQIGSLSASGLYTAPSGLTANAQVSIVATSLADPTQSATAAVSLLAAPVVKVSISPTSFSMASGSVEQFDATVTGTTNTGVTWSASLGSVSGGLYTAPVTSVQENATVTATSLFDPTQTATAAIVVMPQNSSGSGVPANFFGMHVNKTTSPWPTVPFASYRSLDSSYIKWADINTGDQTYDWTNFDKWMNRAESNGQDIMYTLFTTPSWASTRGRHTSNPNYGCVYADVAGPGACDPPNDLFPDGSGTDKHWKDFITAVINHVGPGKIKYWEVWNEFNNNIEWTGTQAQMLRMAKDAYTIIKAMDSNALVTTPSVASPIYGVDNWVAPYLQAGGGDYADIIAIHGYVHSSATVCPSACPDPEVIASILNDTRAVMAANGQRNKPLFDTEGSWGQTTRMTDPDLQAAFTGRYFLIQAAGTPISKAFDKFYWYGWDFRETGQFYSLRGSKLTPAGIAYQQLYGWVVGAVQSGCSKQGTQWTCPMTRSGYQAEAIWDSSQSCSYGTCTTQTITVSPVYTQYRDLAGNVTIISNNKVPVGLKPILLESGNAPGN